MHELTIHDIEQVSGGLTSTYTGMVLADAGEPIMMPSPAPVLPDLC